MVRMTDEEREFWRQREQFKHQDINTLKRHQWTVTNYGLLLYGVLITLARGGERTPHLPEGYGWWVPTLIGLVAVCILWDLEHGLHSARRVTSEAHNRLKPDNVTKETAGRRPLVAVFLCATLGFGSWITTWTLGEQSVCPIVVALLATVAGFLIVRPDKD